MSFGGIIPLALHSLTLIGKADRRLFIRLSLVVEPISMASNPTRVLNTKNLSTKERFFIGEPDGIRTHDPLIKSQMLYRLSYEPSRDVLVYRL